MYYEKPTSSKKCLPASSAMNMNTKMQILLNNMVRRLLVGSYVVRRLVVGSTVDEYDRKILRSGYSIKQTRRILLNGIKNFEAKKKIRLKHFGRKKLIGKTGWFTGKREDVKTVLFCEYTKDGELASSLG